MVRAACNPGGRGREAVASAAPHTHTHPTPFFRVKEGGGGKGGTAPAFLALPTSCFAPPPHGSTLAFPARVSPHVFRQLLGRVRLPSWLHLLNPDAVSRGNVFPRQCRRMQQLLCRTVVPGAFSLVLPLPCGSVFRGSRGVSGLPRWAVRSDPERVVVRTLPHRAV
jgi:hypothetical protein